MGLFAEAPTDNTSLGLQILCQSRGKAGNWWGAERRPLGSGPYCYVPSHLMLSWLASPSTTSFQGTAFVDATVTTDQPPMEQQVPPSLLNYGLCF